MVTDEMKIKYAIIRKVDIPEEDEIETEEMDDAYLNKHRPVSMQLRNNFGKPVDLYHLNEEFNREDYILTIPENFTAPLTTYRRHSLIFRCNATQYFIALHRVVGNEKKFEIDRATHKLESSDLILRGLDEENDEWYDDDGDDESEENDANDHDDDEHSSSVEDNLKAVEPQTIFEEPTQRNAQRMAFSVDGTVSTDFTERQETSVETLVVSETDVPAGRSRRIDVDETTSVVGHLATEKRDTNVALGRDLHETIDTALTEETLLQQGGMVGQLDLMRGLEKS